MFGNNTSGQSQLNIFEENRAPQPTIRDTKINPEDRVTYPTIGSIATNLEDKATVSEKAINAIKESREKEIQGLTLMNAIRNEELDIVKKHINSGTDINGMYSTFRLPLHESVKTGNIDIIKALLDNGANINMLGYRNENVLHCIPEIRKNRAEVVEMLLLEDYGVKINQFNEDGENPIGCIISAHFGMNSEEKLSVIEKIILRGSEITEAYKEACWSLFDKYDKDKKYEWTHGIRHDELKLEDFLTKNYDSEKKYEWACGIRSGELKLEDYLQKTRDDFPITSEYLRDFKIYEPTSANSNLDFSVRLHCIDIIKDNGCCCSLM